MKYAKAASTAAPTVSGAQGGPAVIGAPAFYSWLPSTWPPHTKCDAAFIATLRQIFDESMLGEIGDERAVLAPSSPGLVKAVSR